MRFVRLGLAFYAAALLSGCQSLRRQPPAPLETVRIPPAREGEYATERPRPAASGETETEEPRPRGPVKSIGWPGFGSRSAAQPETANQADSLTPSERTRQPIQAARQATNQSREVPVQTVSNPLTSRMRHLFKRSQDAECTDSCDGSPQHQLDSAGSISEPALVPRGPAAVRAEYGNQAPGSRPTPIQPRPSVESATPRPPVFREPEPPRRVVPPELPPAPAPVPEPPPVPRTEPMPVPPAEPQRTQNSGSPSDTQPARPSLPSVLVEDPPMPVPQVPTDPTVPPVTEPVPAVPKVPPVPQNSAGADATRTPASPKSGKSSTKSRSKSASPGKSSTTPRTTEDDAVLEERLRQSAERMRANGQKTSEAKTDSAQPEAAGAGDDVTDPPLWPKRFGASPPVGEPVVDPLPETDSDAQTTPAGPPPAPPAPAPKPAPAPIPDVPADAPAPIPGLPPTIDLDDEIPRPPRNPPASPSPTSYRPRRGRSI